MVGEKTKTNKQTKKPTNLNTKVMILTSVKTSGDELTWLIVLLICWICVYPMIDQTTWLCLELQPRQKVPLAQSQDRALIAVGS